MEISNAASILVIIISTLLGILLFLVCIAMIAVMRLIRSVKRIVAKAEDVVDSADAVTAAFKNVEGPMAALKLVKNIIELVSDHKKSKK